MKSCSKIFSVLLLLSFCAPLVAGKKTKKQELKFEPIENVQLTQNTQPLSYCDVVKNTDLTQSFIYTQEQIKTLALVQRQEEVVKKQHNELEQKRAQQEENLKKEYKERSTKLENQKKTLTDYQSSSQETYTKIVELLQGDSSNLEQTMQKVSTLFKTKDAIAKLEQKIKQSEELQKNLATSLALEVKQEEASPALEVVEEVKPLEEVKQEETSLLWKVVTLGFGGKK